MTAPLIHPGRLAALRRDCIESDALAEAQRHAAFSAAMQWRAHCQEIGQRLAADRLTWAQIEACCAAYDERRLTMWADPAAPGGTTWEVWFEHLCPGSSAVLPPMWKAENRADVFAGIADVRDAVRGVSR